MARLRGKGRRMLVLLAVLGLCFISSLIPFIYPETIMNSLGAFLNHVLGEGLANLGVEGGWVAGRDGVYALSLQGVLAVYLPPILAILFILRGR
ncbi:MAG: hypothetical protein ACRELA_21760 [Candidatus Rokuibacteriota bacterium]